MIDFWVNAVDPRRFLPSMPGAQPPDALPGIGPAGRFSVDQLVADLLTTMDRFGVDQSILNTGLMAEDDDPEVPSIEAVLAATAGCAERFLVAGMPDRVADPIGQARRARELAAEERFVLARVVPMLEDVPIDDRRWYPLYATCAELGLVVSINVGLPGYAARPGSQHPERLADVLCDLPGLHVVAAHMGFPHERYLVGLLRRFPQLSIATTLFWPSELHPTVLEYLRGDGRGRVIWGSDLPVMDLERQLREVDALGLDEPSRTAYLGGAWQALRAAAAAAAHR
jgi:hypothetical protein